MRLTAAVNNALDMCLLTTRCASYMTENNHWKIAAANYKLTQGLIQDFGQKGG